MNQNAIESGDVVKAGEVAAKAGGGLNRDNVPARGDRGSARNLHPIGAAAILQGEAEIVTAQKHDPFHVFGLGGFAEYFDNHVIPFVCRALTRPSMYKYSPLPPPLIRDFHGVPTLVR
jgi:hypothetical protein